MARTVLLADDSVTAQNMGRRILTDAGYEVITVNNGSAALKKIHENRPDLIVLDVYMPGYGGLEVCQRIKESDATMKIPVLLTVGKMEPFKIEEAKRVRADGHIIKPFDASELLAALTRLEDRIVPQSENGRGRQAKAEPKKLTRRRFDEIADDEDEANSTRISYLEETKKRQAQKGSDKEERVINSPVIDPAATRHSELTGQPSADEVSEDAVTFASGPIYKPEPWAEPKAAPEFPIEKPSVFEQPIETFSEAVAASRPEQQEIKSEPGLESDARPGLPYVSEAATPEEAPGSESITASNETQEVAEPPKPEQAPHWVAENVAVTAEEASRSLDEEMRQAQEPEQVAEQQIQEAAHESKEASTTLEAPPEVASQFESQSSETQEQVPREQTAPETDSSGAAFAAAASTAGASYSTEAVASTPEPEPAVGSEAAAAWENWQRIRDSVVNQHVSDAVAQLEQGTSVPVAENQSEAQAPEPAPASPSPDSPTAQSSAETAPQPVSGHDALSSIVDNVLAELKPRLLAEIAKQLSADKK